jgi:hypothetical protein
MLTNIINFSGFWFKRVRKSSGYWLSIALVAIPLGLVMQLSSIEYRYTNPTFAAISNLDNFLQITHVQSQRSSALAPYIAESIEQKSDSTIVYTVAKNLRVNGQEPHLIKADFVSGGYSKLGIKALYGDLNTINFANENEQIHVALSFSYWQSHFNGKEVIGQSMLLNEQAAIITAIMPPDFLSFFRDRHTDILLPYSFIERLGVGKKEEIDPSTISYIIKSEDSETLFINNIMSSLRTDALLFDDESLKLDKAYGISTERLQKILSRLKVLKYVFFILLVFSVIALLSFLASDNERRQNEIALVAMIGASTNDIRIKLSTEVLCIILTLSFFILLCLPATVFFVDTVIPTVNESANQIDGYSLFTLLLFMFFLAISILIFTFFQSSMSKASLGRGATVSLGQKLQTYLLLSLLGCLSCVSVLISLQLTVKQIRYTQFERGYIVDNSYVVEFSFPKIGGTFFVNELPQILVNELSSESIIDSAALTTVPMLLDRSSYSAFYNNAMVPIGGRNNPQVLTNRVSPNYFSVAGITLIKGKTLNWENYKQIVVNESLWKQFFENVELSEAKLKQVGTSGQPIVYEIVGVVSDIYLKDPDDLPEPTIYQLTSTITGNESIYLRSHHNKTVISDIVQLVISRNQINLFSPTVHSLSELVNKQEKPKKALLITSILITTITILTTLLFIISSTRLLLRKSAREIAVKLALGATTIGLVTREFGMVSLLTTLVLFVLVGASNSIYSLGEGLLPSKYSIGLILFIIIFLTLTFFVLFLGMSNVKRRAWSYLS